MSVPPSNESGRKLLDEALAQMVEPEKLVGRYVPFWAREWAEKNGLEVVEASFAPEGQLYIFGAVQVPNLDLRLPQWGGPARV